MIQRLVAITFLCWWIIGCKVQHSSTIANRDLKVSFVYTFKISYFKHLLREGFNRSEAILGVLASDRSGYGEPILSLADNQLIDSLVTIENKKMVLDSLDRIGRVGEGAEGKHVFAYALNKFQSKWLDSLANERYKLFKRSRNENQ